MARLILYNIEYLEGLKGEKANYLKFWRRLVHPKDLINKISQNLKKQNPDILALVELGGNLIVKRQQILDHLKTQLKMNHQFKRIQYQFQGIYAPLKYIPLLNQQSNAILSKKPITNYKIHNLKSGMKNIIIETQIKTSKKATLLLTHLSLSKKSREKQINELIDIINKIKTPIILAGDLNTFQGKKELNNLIKQTNLKIHNPKTNKKTYPSFKPKKRFDYILTSKNIKVKNYKTLDIQLSDHLPVLIDFEIK